ncbi:gamma carbonic anhydrase 1, mitochondrial-like protein [Tanacetum coccineum]
MGGAERLLNRDDTKEENIAMDEAEDGFLKLFKVVNFEYIDELLPGDVNNISIGSGTNIQNHSLVHVAKSNLPGKVHPTMIGDNVTVGHSAILHGYTVEDEAFVGMKATLLDGGSCREACHGCCCFFTIRSASPLNNSELYLDQ